MKDARKKVSHLEVAAERELDNGGDGDSNRSGSGAATKQPAGKKRKDNGDSNQSDSGAATKQPAAKKHGDSIRSGSDGNSNHSGSGAATKQPAAIQLQKRKASVALKDYEDAMIFDDDAVDYNDGDDESEYKFSNNG